MLLRTDSAFEVVGEAGDGITAVRLAAELTPDIVLMDVQMPLMDGIEATRQILSAAAGRRAEGHPIRVLAFSNVDSQYQKAMRDAGAVGCVAKATTGSLLDAIRAAVHGEMDSTPE